MFRGKVVPLPPRLALPLYRAAREALRPTSSAMRQPLDRWQFGCITTRRQWSCLWRTMACPLPSGRRPPKSQPPSP